MKALAFLASSFILLSLLATVFAVLRLPEIRNDVSSLVPDSMLLSTATAPEMKSIQANSPEEDEDNELYHIVFSTSCSPYQDWMSYVFFYHAWKVKQPGHITRIASGCTVSRQEELLKFHQEKIVVPFSKRFHIHFTPDYAKDLSNSEDPWWYFNKPFGCRHWMEHVLGYPQNQAANDKIIMILDADMILFKPLVNNTKTRMWKDNDDAATIRVRHGHPHGQKYTFRSAWLKHNVSYVAGMDSPAVSVNETEAEDNYAVGPPYIATGRDMYKIVTKWTDFVTRLHGVFDGFLAEMYAYSMSAAHLKLPHVIASGLVIAEPDITPEEEGWEFLESLDCDQVCKPIATEKLPPILHYCQMYGLGNWFFWKYRIPKSFFTCQSALLEVSPDDIALKYDYLERPNGERYDFSGNVYAIKQHGFMFCKMTESLNEVAEHYKRLHCTTQEANFHKTLSARNGWISKS